MKVLLSSAWGVSDVSAQTDWLELSAGASGRKNAYQLLSQSIYSIWNQPEGNLKLPTRHIVYLLTHQTREWPYTRYHTMQACYGNSNPFMFLYMMEFYTSNSLQQHVYDCCNWRPTLRRSYIIFISWRKISTTRYGRLFVHLVSLLSCIDLGIALSV